MFKTIKISELYIPVLEHLHQIQSNFEDDNQIQEMLKDVSNLPPVNVIDLGDCYSLSNGYHRLAIFLHLNHHIIRVNILNE